VRKDLVDEYVWILSPACSWTEGSGWNIRASTIYKMLTDEERVYVIRWLNAYVEMQRGRGLTV
jgi:hypothetical protein